MKEESRMGLIDFHAHMAATEASRDRLLATMDKFQIERCVVLAGGLITPQALSRQITTGTGTNVPVPNLQILELCAGNTRLIPFYFANPFESAENYRRLARHFHGLKLINPRSSDR